MVQARIKKAEGFIKWLKDIQSKLPPQATDAGRWIGKAIDKVNVVVKPSRPATHRAIAGCQKSNGASSEFQSDRSSG